MRQMLRTGRRAVTRLRHRLAAGALALAVVHASLVPACAQQREPAAKLPIIRDAEIEMLLRDYASPIFRAAGLSASGVHIYLLNSRAFNAFVAGGRRMFVNVGALVESQTPNQLIGIIAHETGHISGGHLARLRQRLDTAQTLALAAMLLGAGAVATAAATGTPAGGDMGRAVALGAQNAIERSFLAYQRSEELAADRAGVNYLEATGQSSRGMLETFNRIANQAVFTAQGTDPYAMSHPMPRDRIASLEEIAKNSRFYERKDSPELQLRHDLARAKVSGYLDGPSTVARRYPASDQGLVARYARAISAAEAGDPRSALAQVEELIRLKPAYPYFHELKGDILLKIGRPKEAIAPYRKALGLAPGAALVRIGLGHALVSTEDRSLVDEAIRELQKGLDAESEVGLGHRALARAYALKGDEGMAMLAAAQGYLSSGDWKSAREQALRAQARLKPESPAWLKDDHTMKSRPPSKH